MLDLPLNNLSAEVANDVNQLQVRPLGSFTGNANFSGDSSIEMFNINQNLTDAEGAFQSSPSILPTEVVYTNTFREKRTSRFLVADGVLRRSSKDLNPKHKLVKIVQAEQPMPMMNASPL